MGLHACGRSWRGGVIGYLRHRTLASSGNHFCERSGRCRPPPRVGALQKQLVRPAFCAALLAGIIGGLAVRYQLSSSLRLVAVCPCMILVPGPHLLNAAMDLIEGRIHLGAARAVYAAS
ncbi:MAG: threonine/serine exporter family protein, partial [Burkholderiales bacterium]